APTLKLSRSPVMTKAEKSRTASDSARRTEVVNATTSPPRAFFIECNSMQPMPSPRSTSEAPELLRTTPWERQKSATRAWPGCCGIGSHAAVAGLKHCGLSDAYQETLSEAALV